MAKVGLTRASELTGKSPSTIHRAMRKGRLSFETDDHGTRLVDVAELDRVFGVRPEPVQHVDGTQLREDGAALVQLRAELTIAQARMAMLEERLRDAHTRVDELREERDQWRAQAQRLLVDGRGAALAARRRWWQGWRRSQPAEG